MQLTAISSLTSCTDHYLTHHISKLFRVMKLTAILMLAAALQVTARTEGQTVTLDLKNAPIQKVLTEASRQSGISIIYNEALFNGFSPVSIKVKNATIQQVLDECLKGQPFAYSFEGNMIVINKKQIQTPLLQLAESFPPPSDIHGHITDSLGNPLVGASITVKGTQKGTTTDANGNFTLTGVKDNATLIISYTGFDSREIRLSNNPEFKPGVTLAISLIRSTSSLDQVQVIAYGTTTQRLSTGNVTTVTAADIEKQPVNNPLLALEGRVPGLYITQSTGFSGSGVTVQIQGQNSIFNGNDPFYVIDGVPFSSQLLPSISVPVILGNSNSGGTLNSQGGNPLNYINPSDIESISVLKDADATAIYGSRAANGAIIITTKKGKVGRTTVDFNLQQGFGEVAHKLDLLNTSQYLLMRNEASNNDGITPSLSNGDYDLLLWDTTRNTDWQKALIGGTSQYTNLSGTASGGNTNIQYLIGGTYHRETTVFPGNFSDQKGSVHFNLNSVSENRKLRIQFSGNYMIDNNFLPNSDLTQAAIQLAPDAPPLYNKDGTLDWVPDASGATTWPYSSNGANPISYTYITYNNKTTNLVSNAVLSYQLIPGLDIKTDLGYTNLQAAETVIIPLISVPPQTRPFSSSIGNYGNNNINSWIVEPQISYKRAFSKGKLDFIIGSSIEQNNSKGVQLHGSGFASDALIPDIYAAANIYPIATNISIYKYNALFGRLGYNWDDKYLVNLTARRDGSSRFGTVNQFHDFESAGFGWVFSNEDYIKRHVSMISFAKLRASYGTTGSDQIGDFQYLSTYSTVSVAVPYQGLTGLQPTGLSNPYFQWEETKKLEFGLDIGILKDRVLGNATYFQNRSSDELLEYNLPITTGFGGITENFPATVENVGWEVSLHSVNIKEKSFSWSTSINLTIPQNKLKTFPNLSTSSYASSLVAGQPVNIIKAFHSLGVNDTTGVYEFADIKGNPTYNPSYLTDLTKLININPKFYGGFQNLFQYKDVTLDLLFQFVKQIAPNYTFGFYPGTEGYNQPVSVLSRWQNPGDNKPIQKFNSNYSLATTYYYQTESDAGYSDASYIRLKNLSISWQVKNRLVTKSHLQNLRLYVQGQNLLTFTHYAGLDPESKSLGSVPPLRVITFGLQIGL
jgi:TonB-dependent starch-binding outer membrane protein SusC